MNQPLIFTYRRPAIFTFALIFICFFARPAYTLNEQLDLSQSSNGEVSAQLSGIRYPCTISFGETIVSQPAPNEILVSTTIYRMGCASHSDDVPSPYSLTSDLGALPDGIYNIAWTFTLRKGSLPPPIAGKKFVIRSGVLVNSTISVPTLTEWGMLIFMLLAGYSSIYYLRRSLV